MQLFTVFPFIINLNLSFSGYGFVDFENPASAEKAVRSLQSSNFNLQVGMVGTPLNLFITFVII